MKCDSCKHLNQDKTNWWACISCINRPHDLCCYDHYEAVKDELVSAEEWIEQNFTASSTIRQNMYTVIIKAYKAGEVNAAPRHRETQSFLEYWEMIHGETYYKKFRGSFESLWIACKKSHNLAD